jgi:general secretion pathway protein D
MFYPKNVGLKLLTLSLLLQALDANAQFNKYRSRSKFKPQQVQPLPNNMPTPNAEPAIMDLSEEEMAGDEEDMIDSENFAEDNSGSQENYNPNSSSTTTANFGSRSNAAPANKEGKYVNLNPETSFGPEIITSFDFPDTDIMELTKHMQKLTGLNLILDKEVKGKVSIVAPTAITVGDAWKAYLTALDMAGYSIVPSGSFWKIVATREIRYTPTKIYTGSYTPDTDNHIMKVIALKNVDAGEIARNFRPFMTRYGRIIDLRQTNTVIISDTGSNIARLEKMIKFLDVPGYDESLQIIPVVNSSAQEIAKLLDTILKDSSNSAQRRTTPGLSSGPSKQNISKIIAEPRTNSIIAMANAEGARQLRELITKLDVKLVSSSSERVHVYYLNYGNSEELSKTLSAIVTGSARGSSSTTGTATPRIGGMNNPEANIFNEEVKVTADKNNNALVVTASPTDWITLKKVIAKLDIPRDQVYVEGMIMETNVSKTRQFGVEYFGAYGTGAAQKGGFLPSQDIFNVISNNPTNLSGLFIGGGGGGKVEIPIGPNGQKATVNSVNGLIKVIAAHQNTNVLATPQILAMDNVEAVFEVGDTAPIRELVTNNTGQTTSSFKQQEAKLSLKITPQINKVTRFVKLKINQRIDDFKGTPDASGSGVPTTTRSATTEVMVKDKDTVAMGGLLRDKETIQQSKIPLLGDIPVLGWFFKNKKRTVEKVNMLFFLTPRIISPYNKVAGDHTLSIINRRNKDIETFLDGAEDIPHKEQVAVLTKQVKKQRKLNLAEQAAIEAEEEAKKNAPPIEAPNYQEIKEEVQKLKESPEGSN